MNHCDSILGVHVVNVHISKRDIWWQINKLVWGYDSDQKDTLWAKRDLIWDKIVKSGQELEYGGGGINHVKVSPVSAFFEKGFNPKKKNERFDTGVQ